MTHELKTWPKYYSAVFMGLKNFEVRKNDRDFKVGDTLILKEWDPETKKYTGNQIAKFVSFILEGGSFGIAEDTVIMSIN